MASRRRMGSRNRTTSDLAVNARWDVPVWTRHARLKTISYCSGKMFTTFLTQGLTHDTFPSKTHASLTESLQGPCRIPAPSLQDFRTNSAPQDRSYKFPECYFLILSLQHLRACPEVILLSWLSQDFQKAFKDAKSIWQ